MFGPWLLLWLSIASPATVDVYHFELDGRQTPHRRPRGDASPSARHTEVSDSPSTRHKSVVRLLIGFQALWVHLWYFVVGPRG